MTKDNINQFRQVTKINNYTVVVFKLIRYILEKINMSVVKTAVGKTL